MGKFKPSKYQVAIFDKIIENSSNILINAVAGSGKSTTIVTALNIVPESKKILFLAFNKSIVDELKLKVGIKDNAQIKTLHSLGFSILRNYYNSISTDNYKYRNYINKGFREGFFKPDIISDESSGEIFEIPMEDRDFRRYIENIISLVDLARVNLCKSDEEVLEIAFKFDIYLINNELEICKKVLTWGRNNVDTIDFTDMIFLPVRLGLKAPQFDWVFIDECQDLNAAQRELFLKCVKSTGHWVAVGDPRQAIYGFAGADEESFNLLSELPNVIELPLSVCYRCPSSVIQLAQGIVPQIEARENAPEGYVKERCTSEEVNDGDMILCRLTAPLVQLCMKYISEGRKAYIKGRDIGESLKKLIENTKQKKVHEVIISLKQGSSRILKDIIKMRKCSEEDAMNDPKYFAYMDKVQVIEILGGDLRATYALIDRIDEIFSDDKKGICLSTVHKAKGLESERVFILNKESFYLNRAMQKDWTAEQERNIVYVALTRSKQFLGYLDLNRELKRKSKDNKHKK